MDKRFPPCPRCGARMILRDVRDAPYCEHCSMVWPESGGADPEDAVIDVAATPIPPDEDTVQVPARAAPHIEGGPEAQVRRFEVRQYGDGSGCCFAGCLLVLVFFYLAFRGLMSLF